MTTSWNPSDGDVIIITGSVVDGVESNATIVDSLGSSSTPSSSQGRNEQLARIEVAILATILALALLGNGLVGGVLRMMSSRQKLTRMNLMIGHLVVADIGVALFNVLPQMAWKITFRFQGGAVLCKTVAYGQLGVMFVAAYVLVATAVDRYLAICHPLQTHVWNARRMNTLIAGVWCISLAFATPQLFLFSYKQVDGATVYDCRSVFQSDWALTAYVTWAALAIYFVPLLTLVGAYSRICLAVWRSEGFKRRALASGASRLQHPLTSSLAPTTSRRSGRTGVSCGIYWSDAATADDDLMASASYLETRAVSGDSPRLQPSAGGLARRQLAASNSDSVFVPATVGTPTVVKFNGRQRVSSAKLKTVKLTLIVVASYVACYGPFFVAQLWAAWDVNAPYEETPMVIISLLASLNSCVNPWIYLAFNDQVLRQLFVSAVRCRGDWSSSSRRPDAGGSRRGGTRSRRDDPTYFVGSQCSSRSSSESSQTTLECCDCFNTARRRRAPYNTTHSSVIFFSTPATAVPRETTARRNELADGSLRKDARSLKPRVVVMMTSSNESDVEDHPADYNPITVESVALSSLTSRRVKSRSDKLVHPTSRCTTELHDSIELSLMPTRVDSSSA